jgi:hypothetical protein
LDFRPKIARKEGRQITSARATTTVILAYKRLAELKLAPRTVSNYLQSPRCPAYPHFQRHQPDLPEKKSEEMKA